MAASMAFTYDKGYDAQGAKGSVRKIVCAWTSASDGSVSGTVRLVGTLVKATANPSATAPTDDYDVTLTDDDGINLLTASQSSFENRDTSTSEEVYFLVKDTAGTPLAQSVHPVVCGTVTVAITNAGDSKSGVLNLYLRD